MRKWKRLCTWILICLLVIGGIWQASGRTAADTQTDRDSTKENPFIIAVPDIEEGASAFTVSVQAVTPVTMSAFDISVEYDSAVLEVTGEAYSFADEFEEYYDDGYLSCNAKTSSKVVFAGAKLGAGEFAGNVAKITFQIKDSTKIATTVKLVIGSVAGEGTQGVEEQAFDKTSAAYPVVLRQTEFLLGDVDLNGKIQLVDAQLALRSFLRMITLDSTQLLAADVDQNGRVNLTDVQLILKKFLKMIP